MANKKISDYTALTSMADTDLFEIVDVSEAAAADQNKKVTPATLKTAFSTGGSHAVTGFAATSHNHAASDINSGTLTDARVAESNVTQHQAALSVTESQISDLAHFSTKSITEASHGLSAGEAASFDGSNWVKADADNSLPCHAIVASVTDANTFVAATDGFHTLTSHGFTLGQNFLSATAGAVTTTEPGPGNIIQRVLVAVDANTVLVRIGEPLT